MTTSLSRLARLPAPYENATTVLCACSCALRDDHAAGGAQAQPAGAGLEGLKEADGGCGGGTQDRIMTEITATKVQRQHLWEILRNGTNPMRKTISR